MAIKSVLGAVHGYGCILGLGTAALDVGRATAGQTPAADGDSAMRQIEWLYMLSALITFGLAVYIFVKGL